MLYIFLSGLLWGTIGLFVKAMAALGADEPQICVLRMMSACLIMSVIAVLVLGIKAFIIDRRSLLLCAMLGLVSHGLFNISYTASIRLNGMGLACVLMYTAPVFTAIASRIVFREEFSAKKITALLVNIAGCILTVTGGRMSADSLNLTGITAGISSGFCYGMAAIFAKLAGNRTNALTMSLYSYLFASVFLCAALRPSIPADAYIIGTGFLYGLVPTSLAYVLYYVGLAKVKDTSQVPVIASIEPVTAIIIGMIIYGEQLGTGNILGAAIVLISMIMMVKS